MDFKQWKSKIDAIFSEHQSKLYKQKTQGDLNELAIQMERNYEVNKNLVEDLNNLNIELNEEESSLLENHIKIRLNEFTKEMLS